VQHAAHVVGQRLVIGPVVGRIAALREAAELGGQPADPHAELVGGAQIDKRSRRLEAMTRKTYLHGRRRVAREVDAHLER
jgi:hypothetical protein